MVTFPADPYVTYLQFISRRLQADESPDIYLAELLHLASLFREIPVKGLACVFIAGLPESVRRLLRAGSQMEVLDQPQILARTRAVVSDDDVGGVQEVCFEARTKNPKTTPGSTVFRL